MQLWILPLILTLSALLISCAKPTNKPETLTATQLLPYYYAARLNSTDVYCYVAYYRADDPMVMYTLEDDVMITCNGSPATLNPSGYYAYFTQTSNDPIRITLVRPKTATSTVTYTDLQ